MEGLVTFEIAKKLKSKGFNEECFGWFYPAEVCGFDYKTTIVLNNSEYRGSNYIDMLVSHKDENHIDAPTPSQVLKWLRDEKDIVVSIYPHYHYGKGTNTYWRWDVQTPVYTVDIPTNVKQNDFGYYEQAALAGIEYVLDNII